LTILIFSSCGTEEEELPKGALPFESLTFSLSCGWCIGNHSIEIKDDTNIDYYYRNCSEEFESNRTLTEDEIQKIKDFFVLEDILNISLDQCGECYDGCDDTIILKGLNGENHTIRYDQFDDYDELIQISRLIETLLEIRLSFQ